MPFYINFEEVKNFKVDRVGDFASGKRREKMSEGKKERRKRKRKKVNILGEREGKSKDPRPMFWLFLS